MPSPAISEIFEAQWTCAAQFDPVLRAFPSLWPALAKRHLRTRAFQRETVFDAIAHSQAVVCAGVDVPVRDAQRLGLRAALLQGIGRAFPEDERFSAQTGPSRIRRRLGIAELLRRWEGARAILGITDLHVRGTRLEKDINTDQLSAFNLLPRGSEAMRRQEMMTLVISSRGNVTDSHSDDPDGSNHCFLGRKLWLAWDTFEGRRAGLQDCSRDPIRERARFSLRAFSRLQSACWWTVGPGETLFLPGRLSHRVITLEPYIGIGSFYVTPCSCLENLARWYWHGPLWSLDDPQGDNRGLVDEISQTMTRCVPQWARQSRTRQNQWGLDSARTGMEDWHRRWSAAQRRQLMQRPTFQNLVRALEAVQ